MYMLCDYGCNKEAIFVLKNGKNCCSSRPSGCDVQKRINGDALKTAYKNGKRVSAKQNYECLPQDTKDRMAWSRGKTLTPNDEIFIEYSGYTNELVKGRIFKDQIIEYKCYECKITDWNNKPITLELDHINGVNNDHRLENLRFLCPNCHSQTDTYKGRNKNTGKIIVSDEELLTAYEKEGNIRKALQFVGLAAKGGNYKRMKKILACVAQLGEAGDFEERVKAHNGANPKSSPKNLQSTGSNPVTGTIFIFKDD